MENYNTGVFVFWFVQARRGDASFCALEICALEIHPDPGVRAVDVGPAVRLAGRKLGAAW